MVEMILTTMQSRTQTLGCLTRMPDEIKGSGIIQNRIPQIVVPGLHCACPNARTTNDELPKRELEYGLKDIGKKAFRLKRKQHEELQSRKTK